MEPGRDPGPAGAQGPAGAAGPQGPAGPAGLSAAFTNYGPTSWQSISSGTTQTVASVTLPAGSYTLAPTIAGAAVGDARSLSCYFVSAAPLQGNAVLLQLADIASNRQPLIGDVQVAIDNTAVFLRCTALDGGFEVLGNIIAIRVGTVTPSL